MYKNRIADSLLARKIAGMTAVGDYAYTRPDGIHVVPIGCLKN